MYEQEDELKSHHYLAFGTQEKMKTELKYGHQSLTFEGRSVHDE